MKARELGERRSAWAGLALALAALMAMWAAAAASAAPQVFWQSAVGNGNPGARGVAASPINPGHVFATDQTGARVVELTVWGELVKIWGWDVVTSGPDDTAADQFEICVPADGDTCKAGAAGSGVGQMSAFGAVGAAVDSTGNVYVFDAEALRVQKFDPEGHFLEMWGKGVNTGTDANKEICTNAGPPAEVCGAGGEGTGPGQFGVVGLGDYIEIDSEDKVYVGDVGRIQRFDTNGVFQGETAVPGEIVNALSSDSDGDLYVAYRQGFFDSKANVRKLDPSSGEELCRFEAKNPRAVSVAGDGDVYAFDKLGASEAKIKRYGPACSGGSPPPPTPPQESFGEGLNIESTGLATSSACGIEGVDVYHANPNPSFIRAYGPFPDPDICPQPPLAPQISAQYATSVGTDSASVEAQINPFFWTDATYYLEYGTADCSASPCRKLLLPGAPLTSEVLNEGVPADAEIEGLAPGTTYHFRFVTESGGGGPVYGPDSTFHTYATPAYDTACHNHAYRNSAAAKLPDCRAYEMVSPVDKNGGDAYAYFYEGLDATEAFNGRDQATPDGAALAYSAAAVFAGSEGAPANPEYIAKRGGTRWTTESINPPMRGGPTSEAGKVTSQYKFFSTDLCQGWLVAEAGAPLVPGPAPGFRNIYRRENCATPPTYTWLESSAEEPEPCTNECPAPTLYPDLQGVSGDGSCAAFRVNDALADAPRGLPSPEVSLSQLYLWCEGQPVRLVSKLPGGAPFAGQSTAGTENGAFDVNGAGNTETVKHALSADGTRVYWTASAAAASASEASKKAVGKLFLRVNAGAAESGNCTEPGKACTLQVSPSGFENRDTAQFWTANSDGTRAIFSISDGPDKGNLYQFTFDPATGAHSSTLIGSSEGALGVVGSSEDATRVYFVYIPVPAAGSGDVVEGSTEITDVNTTNGVFKVGQAIKGTGIPGGATIVAVHKMAGTLTLSAAANASGVGVALEAIDLLTDDEENSEGDSAVAGKPNLYLWEEGTAGGETSFVGTLTAQDAPPAVSIPSPITPVPRDRIARASADGGRLLFTSAASLTGYDNKDVVSGVPDREVYLYDAEAIGGPVLRCVSCNPSGARPHGVDTARLPHAGGGAATLWAAAYVPGYQNDLYGRRLITSGGNRVFFNSLDALVPQDINHAQDVYQWEAPGTGDCTEASTSYSSQNAGCVSLISSGESPETSEFVDASASGKDVFFRTSSSLVPQDPGLIDIYDARVDGGFPPPVEPPAPCQGEACQSPPPAPQAKTPASSSFHGPGDLGQGRECSPLAHRLHALALRHRALRHRARALARRAGRTPDPQSTRALRRRAHRLAKLARRRAGVAKRLARRTKACRSANRRAR